MICQQCAHDLNQAVATRSKCLEADEFFRSIHDPSMLEDNLKCAIKDEPLDEHDSFLDVQLSITENNEAAEKPKDQLTRTRRKISKPESLKHHNSQSQLKDEANYPNSNSFECPTCFKVFATISYLKIHKRAQHSYRQEVSCSKCDKMLCDSYALVRHERRKHSGIERPLEKTLICDLCPYKTNTKALLRIHINGAHTTRQRILCRVCGKIVSNKANLKVHERTHFDVDPSDYVPCPVCQKSFKFKSLMVEHKKIVHDRLKT